LALATDLEPSGRRRRRQPSPRSAAVRCWAAHHSALPARAAANSSVTSRHRR
jgi:hypothetical protein